MISEVKEGLNLLIEVRGKEVWVDLLELHLLERQGVFLKRGVCLSLGAGLDLLYLRLGVRGCGVGFFPRGQEL